MRFVDFLVDVCIYAGGLAGFKYLWVLLLAFFLCPGLRSQRQRAAQHAVLLTGVGRAAGL